MLFILQCPDGFGGVCWKKLELSTEKTLTLISRIYARAGKKEKGFREREFLPALAFAVSFFAAAIFHASEAGTLKRLRMNKIRENLI